MSQICLPVVVDLPESTWPITTTLMCIFSLLHCTKMSAKYLLRCLESEYHRRDDRSMLLDKLIPYPMIAVVESDGLSKGYVVLFEKGEAADESQ